MDEDWEYILSDPVKSIMRSQWNEGISTHYKTLSLWTPFAEAITNKKVLEIKMTELERQGDVRFENADL